MNRNYYILTSAGLYKSKIKYSVIRITLKSWICSILFNRLISKCYRTAQFTLKSFKD